MSEHLKTAEKDEPQQAQLFDAGPVDQYRFKVRVGSPIAIPADLAARIWPGRRGVRVHGTFSGNMLDFDGSTKKGDGSFDLVLIAEVDELAVTKVEGA